MLNLFLQNSLIVFIVMGLVFVINTMLKRHDYIDIAWGLGFIIIAISSLIVTQNYALQAILVLLVTLIWGARLVVHLWLRNTRKEEDYRYRSWRESWGQYFLLRAYFQIYLLQGVLMLLIALPIMASFAAAQGQSLRIINYLGIIIFIMGLVFETIGDWQLKKFKQNPENKGKIIESGLWQYTRHPNYFGEVVLWWGIYLISFSLQSEIYLAIIGPLTITFLILKVSGIPLLEEKYADDPEYKDYQKRVNKFWPNFIKLGRDLFIKKA
jgi:steroid 5-alpha reductase family enzyme